MSDLRARLLLKNHEIIRAVSRVYGADYMEAVEGADRLIADYAALHGAMAALEEAKLRIRHARVHLVLEAIDTLKAEVEKLKDG